MSVKKWMGSTPVICDLCGGKFGKVFYDAHIPGYSWGMICHGCFTSHGCKLGQGAGQKYSTATLEKIVG